LKFIYDKELYMFWTDLLSIIRSLNTVYTAIGIFQASYVDCLLAKSGWMSSMSHKQNRHININFMVNPCINNVQHFNFQLMHTTLKT